MELYVNHASTLEDKTTEVGSVFPLTPVRNCFGLNQSNRKHNAGPTDWQKFCCSPLMGSIGAAVEVDVKREQATQWGQGKHGSSQE